MMSKLAIRLSAFIIIVSLLPITVAMLVGGSIDTYAVSAIVSNSSASDGIFQRLFLFDLSRDLRVNYRLPMENVANVNIWYGNDNLIVTTQKNGRLRSGDHQRDLYLYNLHTGNHTLINAVRSEELLGGTPYLITLSPSRDKLIFYETYDRNLYLYDLNTGTKSIILNMEDSTSPYPSVIWSPDGTRVAVNTDYSNTTDNKIQIVDVESGEIRDFPIPTGDFYPQWSNDGEYLILRRFINGANVAVNILRVSDGEPHPFTDVNAIWFTWGACEGKWLTYVGFDEMQRTGYIRNVETGETHQLNHHPMLKTLEVGSVYPHPDCEHFLVSGFRGTATMFETRFAPLYLVNHDLTSVRLVNPYAAVLEMEDNTLVYEVFDRETGRTTLYRRTLSPYSAPTVVAEYESLETWMRWSEDYRFALFSADNLRRQYTPFGGRLAMLNPENGRIKYLTEETERVEYYNFYRWQDSKNGITP